MKYLRNRFAACIVSIFGSLLIGNYAIAQGDPEQLLDTITITGMNFAIELNEERPPNFDELIPPDPGGDPGRDFADCDLSTINGLTCIDRDNIRHWPNASDPNSSSILFNCKNDLLPFNKKKNDPCTAIARGAQGDMYVGARQNGKANIVVHFVEDSNGNDPGGCPATHTAFTDDTDPSGTSYMCFAALATGRPLIEDIDVIEGSQADAFSDGETVLLVLEERKTVLLYSNFEVDPSLTEVDVIGSGKRNFDLNGKEQIVNAMLMEYVRPDAEPSDFFVIVATDRGRLISVSTVGALSPMEVFDMTDVPAIAGSCPPGEDDFDVAQGPDAFFTYATDRNGCVLAALTNDFDGDDNFDGFSLFTSVSTSTDAAGNDLFGPLTINTSPGIGFDLEDDCAPPNNPGGCTLISVNNQNAASLADVVVASAESGVILLHVTGLPDCGWIPITCVDLLDGPDFTGDRDGAVAWLKVAANIPGSSEAALFNADPASAEAAPPAQELVRNISPFFPPEVTDLFDASETPPTGLPAVKFIQDYRAQPGKGFTFDALVFVPEVGVVTDGVMTIDVDVDLLTGTELGCETAADLEDDNFVIDPDDPATLQRLLDWDITNRASERFPTFDAHHSDADENFQGTMINADCINPSRGRSGGISVFPVDFEVTKCPVTLRSTGPLAGTLATDTANGTDCDADDAVFGKLFVTLYNELLAQLQERACRESAPGADDAPLSQSTCGTLEHTWFVGQDKLSKTFLSVINKKQSSPKENFQSFLVHFNSYRDTLLNANTMGRSDPANYVGEQAARLESLDHLLFDKVIPSIPPAPSGWDEIDDTWAQ